ncbi:tryptophan synthase subunit alpha [Agrococcus jejuensis]|uniref:tryptophan synthase subunit alpha n=1 Tax=Agrococcus jejuensis TaxID=399736 RepID=UPI0011A69630|nr:tryptophan synthase subunit alpha [Agrococcus jejuensis]
MTQQPAPHPSPQRRASLEVLRAEAADERSVLVDERLRAGEDPWDFMADLPTVDELVVLLLRSERILPPGAVRPDEDVSDVVLRRIAADYPPLATTVWTMLSEAESVRVWAPRIRRVGR